MTFVTPDHIRKTMEKHQRCIFYVYDDKKGLLHASEDCDTPAAAYSELEDYLEGCIGSHVIVELPATAKGQGRKGGNRMTSDEAKFEFKVKLQSGNQRNEMGGGSNLSLIMSLMEKQNALQSQMLAKEHSHQLELVRRDMEEMKKKKKDKEDTGLSGFADMMWKKYQEAERVKGIAREVTTRHAPAPAAEPAGAMAAETPHPGKEKLKGAINTFKEVDADYIDNMAFLADYAKKNPEIYKEFLAGLKGAAA